ncbi:MAG: nuclear transport factor 2 family protein [Runella sp.]
MKNFTKLFLIVAILSLWLTKSYVILAQNAAAAKVEALERQRFEAMVGQNFAVLDPMLADDLYYCHSSGLIDTKTSFLQSLKEGKLIYKEMTPEKINVRVYGKTAVITGFCKMKAISNGQEISTRFHYTDVYVKNKSGWQLVTWQSLRLP